MSDTDIYGYPITESAKEGGSINMQCIHETEAGISCYRPYKKGYGESSCVYTNCCPLEYKSEPWMGEDGVQLLGKVTSEGRASTCEMDNAAAECDNKTVQEREAAGLPGDITQCKQSICNTQGYIVPLNIHHKCMNQELKTQTGISLGYPKSCVETQCEPEPNYTIFYMTGASSSFCFCMCIFILVLLASMGSGKN